MVAENDDVMFNNINNRNKHNNFLWSSILNPKMKILLLKESKIWIFTRLRKPGAKMQKIVQN